MRRRDYLTHAFIDAKVIELRHQSGEQWASGVFDDAVLLRHTIRDLASVGNLYITLNVPDGVEVTNAMTGRALRNEDIKAIVRIPFDFDPVRPAGTASTEGELASARRQRDRLVSMLTALGWPLPAVATSGNGAHALYRCRLPNSNEVAEMLAKLYRGLKQEFSTEEVLFDASVRNAARIWRLYGTVNRKGTPTADRPHRMATVAIPNRWDGVAPKAIEMLAAKYARRPAPAEPRSNVVFLGAGDFATLDVIGWFTAHGLYKRPLAEGKHSVYCPWRDEHTTPSTATSTDTVIWPAEGGRWPTFHCSHAHCEGRGLAEVMRLWRDADAYCARPYQRRAA
jgi:hypothetical protein